MYDKLVKYDTQLKIKPLVLNLFDLSCLNIQYFIKNIKDWGKV